MVCTAQLVEHGAYPAKVVGSIHGETHTEKCMHALQSCFGYKRLLCYIIISIYYNNHNFLLVACCTEECSLTENLMELAVSLQPEREQKEERHPTQQHIPLGLSWQNPRSLPLDRDFPPGTSSAF